MPNPLSKVCPSAEPNFSPTAGEERPELASHISSIFCKWAWIEHHQSLLIVSLLGGSSDAAIAMFKSLESDRARNEMLSAAAKATLVGAEYEAFQAALLAIRPAQKHRNKLAHHVWGTCTELPDQLILIDSKHLAPHREHVMRIVSSATNKQPPPPSAINYIQKGLNKSNMLVFDIRDLQNMDQDLSDAADVVRRLTDFLLWRALPIDSATPPHLRHKTRGTKSYSLRQLARLNLFQKARTQLREGRRKRQQQRSG